jgi:hypothetical protein
VKTLTALMAVVCLCGLYGAVDIMDRATDERIALQRWAEDACIPTRAGDRAVIVSDGSRVRCTIYSNTDYGRAPVVVSAAVLELPL